MEHNLPIQNLTQNVKTKYNVIKKHKGGKT